MRSKKNGYIFNKTRARARETVKHPISFTFPIRKNPNSGQQILNQITPIDKCFIWLLKLLIFIHVP